MIDIGRGKGNNLATREKKPLVALCQRIVGIVVVINTMEVDHSITSLLKRCNLIMHTGQAYFSHFQDIHLSSRYM